MDDTREVCPKRSLNRQADAKAGTDQAFDAFAAYIMSHHFWPVCWRGKPGDNHVMNLMSGITSAQQKRFALEVGPMNDRDSSCQVLSRGVSARHGELRHQPTLTKQESVQVVIVLQAGMMGDRASVIFAAPDEINKFVEPRC